MTRARLSDPQRDAVMAWPPMQEWTAAAEQEPWVIEFPEVP